MNRQSMVSLWLMAFLVALPFTPVQGYLHIDHGDSTLLPISDAAAVLDSLREECPGDGNGGWEKTKDVWPPEWDGIPRYTDDGDPAICSTARRVIAYIQPSR